MIRYIAPLAIFTMLSTSPAYALKDHYGLSRHIAAICVKELNEKYKKIPVTHYTSSEAIPSQSRHTWWTTISFFVHKKWKTNDTISVLPYETECGVDVVTFEIYKLDKPKLMIDADFKLIK